MLRGGLCAVVAMFLIRQTDGQAGKHTDIETNRLLFNRMNRHRDNDWQIY